MKKITLTSYDGTPIRFRSFNGDEKTKQEIINKWRHLYGKKLFDKCKITVT